MKIVKREGPRRKDKMARDLHAEEIQFPELRVLPRYTNGQDVFKEKGMDLSCPRGW